MNPSPTEAFAERLDRVERENRYLRWVGAILMLALASLSIWRPLGPGATQSRRFDLRDNQGRVRATLGFTRGGSPTLEFFNQEGERQISMVAEEHDANLALHQHGQTRVILSAHDDGATALNMFGNNGEAPSAFYTWPEGTSGLFLNGREAPLHLTSHADRPGRLAVLDAGFQEKAALWFTGEGEIDWRKAITATVAAKGELSPNKMTDPTVSGL